MSGAVNVLKHAKLISTLLSVNCNVMRYTYTIDRLSQKKYDNKIKLASVYTKCLSL